MKNYLYAVMFFYLITITAHAEDGGITLDLKEGVVLVTF